MSAGGTSRGDTNSATDDTLKAELRVRDKEQGRVLLVKARQQAHDEATKQEMGRQLHKRRKRLDHTKARRERRAERERMAAELAKSGATVAAVSTPAPGPREGQVQLADGVAAGSDVVMPEPSDEFREVLSWSARAAQALQELRAREKVLKDGYADLAVAESSRREDLAAGNAVGEDAMREEVAKRLVVAAAGLDAIGEKDWTAENSTMLQRSRTRRRYEKRMRKARVKERRELRAALAKLTQPTLAYKAVEEVYRRLGADTERVLSRQEAEAIGFVLPSATKVLRRRPRRQEDDTR
ncbi:hypothetical protein PHYSODRAFT_499254 [Phytophthora sojae]|uniref:Uncharacterized protein n=1 Tax=Phytophthora sojae (strain P6497) TaxID=1094619 RepID=G4ZGX7_PHYSP|nr:hypothetical protein PHYSODRAFT_499254 [Phytophthora sojae]EGZ18043.1 hypothetical protein PHYSODRAFT_499254 [Phytophthora sojae]|eukprot:XP_009527101.1 hypothetical protein PHYSODRAFT_499254 [Phytophthora sojae]